MGGILSLYIWAFWTSLGTIPQHDAERTARVFGMSFIA